MGGSRAIYTIYKGEEVVATGTARELSKELDVTVKTIYWYANSKRQHQRKNGTIAVRVN